MLEKIAFKILAFLTFVGSVFGVYKAVKNSGYNAAKQEHKAQQADEKKAEAKHVVEAVKERVHVEEIVNSRPVGDAAQRLRDEWSRD